MSDKKSYLKAADCKERVAFDLMMHIADQDAMRTIEIRQQDASKYYLELFEKCNDAAHKYGD